MNHKILHKLEQMIHTSPQLLRNPCTLQQAIQGTFDIEIDTVEYKHISELVNRIDDKVLDNYFRNVWQGEMKKYKYSGLALIDEINSLILACHVVVQDWLGKTLLHPDYTN